MASMIKIGSPGWIDLTVEHAESIKDFYEKVIGWEGQPVSMGAYDDFNMNSPTDGATQVGICHARGGNADIPPVWMVYFYVKDLDKSLLALGQLGGQQKGEIRKMGSDRYVLIQDPAGAYCMLYQKGE